MAQWLKITPDMSVCLPACLSVCLSRSLDFRPIGQEPGSHVDRTSSPVSEAVPTHEGETTGVECFPQQDHLQGLWEGPSGRGDGNQEDALQGQIDGPPCSSYSYSPDMISEEETLDFQGLPGLATTLEGIQLTASGPEEERHRPGGGPSNGSKRVARE